MVTNTVTVPVPVTTAPPTAGAALSGFSLPAVQRGNSVAVSLNVGSDNSTVVGRLAKPGATAPARRKKRTAPTAYGSAVQRGVSAAPLTLRIPLNAAARALLKRKHRLAVAVKVTVTTATRTAQSATGRTTLK